MELCLIAPRSHLSGGVSNWERILSLELEKRDDIKVYFINNSSTKRPTDGATLLYRILHGTYVAVRSYIMLRKYVVCRHIDVVHMTTSGGLGFIRDIFLIKYLNHKSIPCVYHVHFGRSNLYKEKNGYQWKQLQKCIENADCTITIDEKTYSLFKPIAKHVVYINNPIDVSNYKSYRITDENKIIYIGWVIKEKGIEELIEAFEIFNGDGKYELELIGPGKKEYIDYIRSKYELEHTRLLGELHHDEAMKELARASFFILPSYTEGFPNVILEAMSLHKPVIATNVGAISEMIGLDAGILVAPKNVESIISAMDDLEDEEKRKAMGENAYKRVCGLYDIKDTIKKYKRVWEGIKKNER